MSASCPRVLLNILLSAEPGPLPEGSSYARAKRVKLNCVVAGLIIDFCRGEKLENGLRSSNGAFRAIHAIAIEIGGCVREALGKPKRAVKNAGRGGCIARPARNSTEITMASGTQSGKEVDRKRLFTQRHFKIAHSTLVSEELRERFETGYFNIQKKSAQRCDSRHVPSAPLRTLRKR